MQYQNHINYWSTVVGFGTIKSDFSDMEEGIIFGVWEATAWIGVKYRSSRGIAWQIVGPNFLTDMQIWRHTCFSIDFIDGNVKLVENGQVRFKTVWEQVKPLESTMNHVAAGCIYKASGEAK